MGAIGVGCGTLVGLDDFENAPPGSTGGGGATGSGGASSNTGAASVSGSATSSVGGAGGDPCAACTKTDISFGENTANSHHNVTTDTTLRQANPTVNYGSVISITSDGYDPTDLPEVGLFRFELVAIPVNTPVCGAKLHLSVNNQTSSDAFGFHRVLEPWDESLATWEKAAQNPWTDAGCGAPDSRQTDLMSNSTAMNPVGETVFTLVPLAIQDWVDNPSSNHGMAWTWEGGSPSPDGFTVHSHEATLDGMRPWLAVTVCMQ
jgi:hypothetical protein